MHVWSQPSWAAWIEMAATAIKPTCWKSQPSWAAWIEIFSIPVSIWFSFVAALLGCVD